MPLLPYFILYVFAPAANARSWLPRQMPKIGMFWEIAHFSDLIVSLHWEGSPGPLEQKRPSHLRFALRVA